MSNQLDKPGLLQAVTCILGLEGSDAGLTRLAEELTVGLNPWSTDNPEFAICRGDILWAATTLVAAGGAGFRSIISLEVDAQGVGMCVVEGWDVGGSAYRMARGPTVLATDLGNISQALDGRARTQPPYIHFRSSNGIALPAGINNGVFLDRIATTGTLPGLKVVLTDSPFNPKLFWYPAADNLPITITVWGRVRRILNAREVIP